MSEHQRIARCGMSKSDHQPEPWRVDGEGDLVDACGEAIKLVGTSLPWPDAGGLGASNRDRIVALSQAQQPAQEGERPMAERHEWADEEGDRFRIVRGGRVERWWPHEEVWAEAAAMNASAELLRVVAERDEAWRELQRSEAAGDLLLQAAAELLATVRHFAAGLLPEEDA